MYGIRCTDHKTTPQRLSAIVCKPLSNHSHIHARRELQKRVCRGSSTYIIGGTATYASPKSIKPHNTLNCFMHHKICVFEPQCNTCFSFENTVTSAEVCLVRDSQPLDPHNQYIVTVHNQCKPSYGSTHERKDSRNLQSHEKESREPAEYLFTAKSGLPLQERPVPAPVVVDELI